VISMGSKICRGRHRRYGLPRPTETLCQATLTHRTPLPLSDRFLGLSHLPTQKAARQPLHVRFVTILTVRTASERFGSVARKLHRELTNKYSVSELRTCSLSTRHNRHHNYRSGRQNIRSAHVGSAALRLTIRAGIAKRARSSPI